MNVNNRTLFIADNLQLLCAACNSTKGDRTQEYLIDKLREDNIIS